MIMYQLYTNYIFTLYVVRMVSTFGRECGSTGYGCQSWSWLAEQEQKCVFTCPRCSRLKIWSRETGSAVSFRVGPFILHTQAEFGAYSRDSSRFPRRRPSMLHRPVPSLSGNAIAYRWRSLPRVRQHGASRPQGSSSNGCYLFRSHHRLTNVRLYFSTLMVLCNGNVMCDTENIITVQRVCLWSIRTSLVLSLQLRNYGFIKSKLKASRIPILLVVTTRYEVERVISW